MNDRTLKTVALAGGAARIICPVAENPEGISWTADGITFTQSNAIFRVSPGGGKPEALVTLKDGEEAASPARSCRTDSTCCSRWPPAAARPVGESGDRRAIARVGERKTLIQGGTDARFVPTGHLVYALGGSLLAVQFDPRRLVVGTPTSVAEGVRRLGSIGQFTFSDSGSLAYLPGPVSGSATSAADVQIALTDRHGAVQALKIPAGPHTVPRASPDGKRIAFESSDARESLIYVVRRRRHHDDAASYVRRQQSASGLVGRATAGASPINPIVRATRASGGSSPTAAARPSGSRNLKPAKYMCHSRSRVTVNICWSGQTGAPAHSRCPPCCLLPNKQLTRLKTRSRRRRQRRPRFRQTGTGSLYSTTEAGTTTVYVQPFPATGAKFRLTAQAGDVPHHPRWSPDGQRAVLQPSSRRRFEVVRVITQPAFRFGSPVAVPKPSAVGLGPASTPTLYDVMPDGRFLGLMTPGQADAATSAPIVQMVLNWFEELKQRAK